VRFLETLERLARKVVDHPDDEYVQSYARGLLASPYHALGILVARGMLPVLLRKTAGKIFDEILAARDKLNLSPDDLFSDIMDERFTEETGQHSGHEAEDVRKAQRKLAEKANEVRRLKETLDRTRREIARQEKAAAASAVPETPAQPVDPQLLRDLRDKVTELKGALHEQTAERSRLRRDLRAAQEQLEAQPQNHAQANGSDADLKEDELVAPGDLEDNQPVRVIEFPKKFHYALQRFPRATARAAMTIIGRLAAGEAAAYCGVVRLKACHEILRQRVGSDYRLLFQLGPDTLHVVDLINRKDLLVTIKHLRAAHNGG
jgi:hypothetical protein